MVVLAGGRAEKLITGLGLGLIVVGVESLFRAATLFRFEREETADEIGRRLYKLMQEEASPAIIDKLHQMMHDTAAPEIARKIDEMLLEKSLGASGIRMIARKRRGCAEYYIWAITMEQQDLFFAGRSVLHRIDSDLKQRRLGSAEEVIVQKLKEGSTIRILFIDPRSNLISRLAEEEGQTSEKMLKDIAQSLGICRRLFGLLKKEERLNAQAQLQIRIYDKVPYFAYHKQDSKFIIGFYFATALGNTSSAYEILDAHTQALFDDHFTSIFTHSSTLLELSPQKGLPDFNEELFNKLYGELVRSLTAEATEKLVSMSRGA
jgi:uncharacterized protein DUF5919